MKNMNAFEVPQRARSPGRCQLDRCPSNFLRWPRRNFGSQCFRHKLCAKTYTKRRAQDFEATGNQCHFAAEKGIFFFFVDADRDAQGKKKPSDLYRRKREKKRPAGLSLCLLGPKGRESVRRFVEAKCRAPKKPCHCQALGRLWLCRPPGCEMP
jgi:hypothetical protein